MFSEYLSEDFVLEAFKPVHHSSIFDEAVLCLGGIKLC